MEQIPTTRWSCAGFLFFVFFCLLIAWEIVLLLASCVALPLGLLHDVTLVPVGFTVERPLMLHRLVLSLISFIL